MIQVFWYKRTGRRVFLMAPLHHHFEKKGWAEPTIVIRFWIISMILALGRSGDVEDPMSVFPPTSFAGERFAVVGLGKNGLPAARALRAMGADVGRGTISAAARAAASAEGDRCARAGDGRAVDALVLSPGIPHRLPEPHPIAAARHRRRGADPVRCRSAVSRRCGRRARAARFAGITGTNGKSTTTALLAHIWQVAGRAGGGGRQSRARRRWRLPLLPQDGVYVLEMSSYMLERIARLRFDAAAMLNLSADHLDRHGDMDGYAGAKLAIFARQTCGGYRPWWAWTMRAAAPWLRNCASARPMS